MSSLSIELALSVLLDNEPQDEVKLDLLTEIGLTTTNKEIFEVCEKIRDAICSGQDSQGKSDDLCGEKEPQEICDSRDEESNDLDGEE